MVDDPNAFFGFYLENVGEEIQTTFTSTPDMLDHLMQHTKAGHYVPPGTLVDLVLDDLENFGGTTS